MVVDVACSGGLLLLIAVLGVAYAAKVLRAGAASFDRVKRDQGSVLFGAGAMQMGYWGLDPLGRALAAAGVTPNAISLASLVLGLAAAGAIAVGHFGVAAALSVVSSLCDALDGMVARHTKTASDAGEVLDAAVDRYVEFAFLAGLVVYGAGEPVWVGASLAAILGSFMVSYATAKAEAMGVEAPRGAMRRPERAAYLTLGAGLSPLTAAWAARGGPAWAASLPMLAAAILVGAVGNVSAIRRLRAVARALRARAASSPPRAADPGPAAREPGPPPPATLRQAANG